MTEVKFINPLRGMSATPTYVVGTKQFRRLQRRFADADAGTAQRPRRERHESESASAAPVPVLRPLSGLDMLWPTSLPAATAARRS
jgi:hypothetical protein